MKRLFRQYPLLIAFVLLLLVFGALVAKKYLASTPTPQPVVELPAEPRSTREVILYFGSPDGLYLFPEGREIEDCLDEIDCLRETVQALINGPLGDLTPIFPSHTVIRNITIEQGLATIDFSRDLVSGHPGGSLSELFTVYGLADTIAANFPHLRRVRILIEGESIESLKGHVGLREPISADFRYTREPAAESGALRPESIRPSEGGD